jgi:uncharacterized Zn finger protein (UPF0148 family)
MKCPVCELERKPGAIKCPECGIEFSKYLKEQSGKASAPQSKAAPSQVTVKKSPQPGRYREVIKMDK